MQIKIVVIAAALFFGAIALLINGYRHSSRRLARMAEGRARQKRLADNRMDLLKRSKDDQAK